MFDVVAGGNPYFNLEKSSVLQEVAIKLLKMNAMCFVCFCQVPVMSLCLTQIQYELLVVSSLVTGKLELLFLKNYINSRIIARDVLLK